MSSSFTRETLPDGRVRLADPRCSFTFERLRRGALLVTVTGMDRGQFGAAALDEIRIELFRHPPLELFVDGEATTMVDVDVSRAWTGFFSLHREQLRRVSVLVGSKAVELTIAIAQHLARTGNLLQIYTDRELFDERVNAARR